MSMAAIRRVFDTRGLKHGLKILLLNCAWHANADGETWQGIDTMARETGLQERQVGRNLEALIELGLIERKRRQGPDRSGNIRRLSNSFRLLLDGPALAKMSDSSMRKMSDSNSGAKRHSGKACTTFSDELTDISAPVYRKNPVQNPEREPSNSIEGDFFSAKSTNSPKKKTVRKQKAPSRKTPMPDDWPSAELKAWAVEYWTKHNRRDLADRVELVADEARAHHLSKNTKFVCWEKAFQTWCIRAVGWNRANGQRSNIAIVAEKLILEAQSKS